jgi:hypothetical protein
LRTPLHCALSELASLDGEGCSCHLLTRRLGGFDFSCLTPLGSLTLRRQRGCILLLQFHDMLSLLVLDTCIFSQPNLSIQSRGLDITVDTVHHARIPSSRYSSIGAVHSQSQTLPYSLLSASSFTPSRLQLRVSHFATLVCLPLPHLAVSCYRPATPTPFTSSFQPF